MLETIVVWLLVGAALLMLAVCGRGKGLPGSCSCGSDPSKCGLASQCSSAPDKDGSEADETQS